jgi:cytochrome P450
MNAADIVEALMAPAGRADPYPLYAKAHQLGAAAAITDDLFLISGYDAVNQVLRNPGFGVADPDDSATHDSLTALNRSILRTNPPEHRRMRSLISSVFTPRRVAGLSPVIETSVDLLLDGISGAGVPVDFMEEFAFQLPVSVICEMLGVPQSDRHRFRTLAADLTILLELAPHADSLGPASAAAQELADYFGDLITDRRDNPRDDLISALVAARDAKDGRLSEVELVANLVVLLARAHLPRQQPGPTRSTHRLSPAPRPIPPAVTVRSTHPPRPPHPPRLRNVADHNYRAVLRGSSVSWRRWKS